MNSHPAIEQAVRVLSAAQTKWCVLSGLTPEQVRNCIVVEITPQAMVDVICHPNTTNGQAPQYGPRTIMGIRFYLVDNLPDGDDWRVLNALGTN